MRTVTVAGRSGWVRYTSDKPAMPGFSGIHYQRDDRSPLFIVVKSRKYFITSMNARESFAGPYKRLSEAQIVVETCDALQHDLVTKTRWGGDETS